jgi:hypothetical protein
MKYWTFLLISMIFIASCRRDEPVSYQVPKPSATPPPKAQPMGSDAANQAIQAAHAATAAQEPAGLGFTADVPAGWKAVPSSSAMRKVSYAIDGTSIDFYAITLTMGDVPSNVNRWRGQVGLPPASAEEIAAGVQSFKVNGHKVSYTESYNQEGGRGIIAAIIDLAPKYWYFTAKGTVPELEASAADIQAFIKSIRFEGHNH